MQIDPNDRIGGRYDSQPKSKLGLFAGMFFGVIALLVVGIGLAMWLSPGFSNRVAAFINGTSVVDQNIYKNLYQELGIGPLPATIAAKPKIHRALSVLNSRKMRLKSTWSFDE